MARGDIFRKLPKPRVGKSNFDLSFDHRTTFDMGYLIPILCEDTLPGDQWTMSCEPFVRAAALLAPVMSRIDVTVDYFHVSNRIMWPSWDRWLKSELINEPPYIIANGSAPNVITPGSLGDYIGYPAFDTLNNHTPLKLSAFPLAAYNMIWNEYYRHQHVQTALDQTLDNDDNSADFLAYALNNPQFRCWDKDYFTSANPFPSAGAAVNIPVGHLQGGMNVRKSSDDSLVISENVQTSASGKLEGAAAGNIYTDAIHEGTIEDLRTSIKVQEWFEKLLRGGTRLREMLWTFFGVDNMDMRMQVPEFIGRSTQSLKISEILTTGETIDSLDNIVNPVGQMAGHGVSAGMTKQFRYFAREHGWIIAILNVQPKPTYMNRGVHKKFSRDDLYKYYWPQFANLGEEVVQNKEIFIDDTATVQEAAFGYQARYSDYRFRNNRVSGEFGTNLDFWTFARKFVSTPVLNETFVRASTDVRPFAVKDGSHNMRGMVYHNIKCVRPLPRFSTPKTGG